ncbi:cadherin domain-containing protein [Aporhodopirellula aestuarii]|uniref:Cadherin domain-containing protein n=1 Tax=Aporhodopirellula aestuarii TaxID=2950107 RepID=A0ABT0TZC1_9BACT|nr:cadherin domain-containing protein [Aporhodopirellula aestuarii]MCM2369952.1 cadherin domain-containing protein [Aporhodopirellula aestuarii]
MKPAVQRLLSRFTSKKKRSPRYQSRSSVSNDRRLTLESLESRRVLAATIASFTPTSSGFTAELSEQISTQNLSLYDTEGGVAGAADVTLQGATTGSVRGSLVVNGTTVTFIASGGPLAADTYTATLRSASDAFTDLADGELLDGDNDGTAGGNFVTTFTVSNNSSLVVGLPDVVRGPSQAVQVPANGSGVGLPAGLPIQLSDADGVTSVTLTIQYDPNVLDVTGVQLGADAPTGSQVEANLDTPGVITISFFSLTPMEAGQADIVDIIASIPEDAPYGTVQTLQISSVEVNAGDLTATTDDAIQVVAFPGDVNANRRYDAEDARLVARVGIGLDSGFVANSSTSVAAANVPFAAIDPVLLGDVTGVDGLSPLDASDLLRRVVGLSTPNIPSLPDAQAPTNVTLSSSTVAEDLAIGSTVGTFTTADPDTSDTHTYSLVAGTGDTDNDAFTISGNTLLTAEVFDASVQDSYTIRVRTTDSTGRTFERVFTLSVTDANVAPTAISLSDQSITENEAAGTAVGTLSTTDSNVNDTFTYSLVSVDGSTSDTTFAISGSSLVATGSLDFETKSSYTVVIRSTDQDGLSVDQTFTISVLNANESPTALTLSNNAIANASAAGTVVGTLSTTDVDASDTFTYSLVSGTGDTDNDSFTVVGDELRADTTIDFSSQTSYSVRVRTTDAAGETFEQTFTIVQSDAGPTALSLSDATIAENGADGNVVGTFTTTDPTSGDTFTYTLVSGDGDDDNAKFVISGAQLQTVASLDAETDGTLSVRVRSTDSTGEFIEETFTITVTSINEAPTTITLSGTNVASGQPSGTVVGSLGTDDPDVGDTITYSFVTGTGDTDNASFVISGDQVVTAFTANQQTQASYTIRVLAQDSQGLATQQSFTITVSETNVAPTDISLSNATVDENVDVGTVVGTLSTTDANSSDTFTYEFVSGEGDADNDSFAIDGSNLVTATTLDFESKSSYTVRVQSSDPFGLVVVETFTITVNDVNDAPTETTIDNSSVAEDAVIGSVVGAFSTTDDDASDTFTYALVSGEGDTDNASFAVDGSNLVTATTLDFETQSSYSIRVQTTDAAGASIEQVFTFTVTDVNDAPTAITLDSTSVDENAAVGTAVGEFSTTDADASDTFTYSLVSGDGDDDNGAFAIDGGNLVTATTFDFATKSSYTVRVQSTDAAGASIEQVFTISVTQGNQTPTAITIDNSSISENSAVGSVVGGLTTTDPDSSDTFTYSLVAGEGDTDNDSFAIDGSNLVTAETLDFETQSSYSVRVRTTDSAGASFEQVLSITVTDVNDAPTAIALDNSDVSEDASVGTVVGELSTTDEDASDTFTYSLIDGEGDTDNASFAIDGSNLVTATTLDFETQSSYSVRVQTVDAAGASFEQVLTITVTDVNDAPTAITLDNSAVDENATFGTVVGGFSTTDADVSDTFTYSLISGDGDDDNGSFAIDGGNLVTATTFDFAAKSSYTVRVQSTDASGASIEQVFAISITQGNSAPTAIAIDNSSVAEDSAVGSVVGGLSTTDADASDTFTYSLVAGEGDTDNDSFAIDDSNLVTAATLDFETQSSYSVRIRTTDAAGASFEQVLSITVTDVNDAPTAIALDNNSVSEDASVGTVVGELSTTDDDATDTFTYSLVGGEGDTDNASFAIDGSNLVTATTLDFDTQSSYSIRVQSTDGAGASVEQVLTISVTQANQAPTAIAIDNSSISEDATVGAVVGELSTTDADVSDTFTYSLVSGDGDDDNASFAIDGSNLVTATTLDFESQSSYSVRVQSTDLAGESTEQAFTITVTNVNEAPTSILLAFPAIASGEPVGTLVGELGAVDPDENETFTYSFVSGEGDFDNDKFTITNGELRTAEVVDQTIQALYSIRVRVEDAGGLFFEDTADLIITETNVAPTAIELDNNSVTDGSPVGTVVGTLLATDANTFDEHTFSLVSGTGDTDNASFEIVDGKLQTKFTANAITQSFYSIRVLAQDRYGLSFEQVLTVEVPVL